MTKYSSKKSDVYKQLSELKRCSCGGKPFIKGKNGVFAKGFPYQIVCLECNKATSKGNMEIVEIVKKEWNDGLF